MDLVESTSGQQQDATTTTTAKGLRRLIPMVVVVFTLAAIVLFADETDVSTANDLLLTTETTSRTHEETRSQTNNNNQTNSNGKEGMISNRTSNDATTDKNLHSTSTHKDAQPAEKRISSWMAEHGAEEEENDAIYKEWKDFGQKALQSLIDNGAFNTKFSTTSSVLEKGFPLKWKPCTLRDALSRRRILYNDDGKETLLDIIFSGGSATARSATECNVEGQKFGRYTDHLLYEHQMDIVHHGGNYTKTSDKIFDVVNIAHGGTNSIWSAVMMDELFDAHETDILVWEFAINDALGGSTGSPARPQEQLGPILDVWLTRAIHQFKVIGRPPPPIILLYLWNAQDVDEIGNLGQSAFKNQKEVVSKFREAGFNLGIVNVGGSINGTNTDKKNWVWLDDAHHPNCDGVHLISAMLRYLLYSDLVECEATERDPVGDSVSPPVQKQDDPLLSLMLSDSISVSSLMQWQPQHGHSTLAVAGLDGVTTEASAGSKTSDTREDRKFSYGMQPCMDGRLNFTLVEPGLEWIGFKYGGGSYKNNGYDSHISVRLNGVPADAISRNETKIEMAIGENVASDWINVSAVLPGRARDEKVYDISICMDIDERSKCPYLKLSNITEMCLVWERESGKTGACPLDQKGTIGRECFDWYNSKRGQELARKYGQWTGSWGKGTPQLNWILAIKRDGAAV